MAKNKGSDDGLNGRYINDVYHLARLGMSAKPEDVAAYLRKIVRATTSEGVDNMKLVSLLDSSPTRSRPVKNKLVDHIPVDGDSRLNLLHIEEDPILDVDPVWPLEVKVKLESIINERAKEPELLREGLTPIRTALFVGQPGVGKTLAARYLAKALGRPLVTLDLAAVMSSFLGKTGQNIRKVLDYAKGLNCVLLLDEIDSIAKRRSDSTEVGELKRLVNVLLQEIDNWPPNGVLIGATNHAELLDPAVWRRFESRVEFPQPTSSNLRTLVAKLTENLELKKSSIELCASSLAGKSFHDVVSVVREAHKNSIISNISLDEALISSCKNLIQNLTLKERKLIALKLVKEKLSQRSINEITSLSRDTIRKITQ